MERKGEWQQVRHRRRIPNDTTTFFVSGLPEKVHREEVKKLFVRFGNVVDVYVAERRDSSGKFFAFIRYRGVANVEKLEGQLQKVCYQGFPLSVNVARFARKTEAGDNGRMKAPFPRRKVTRTFPEDCPFDKTVESDDDNEEEDEDEDCDGISDTCVGMDDNREEGEFIPSDKVNFPEPADTPAVNPKDGGVSPNIVMENGEDGMSVEIHDEEEEAEESVGNNDNENASRLVGTEENAREGFNAKGQLSGSSDSIAPPSFGPDTGESHNTAPSKDLGRSIHSNGPPLQPPIGEHDACPTGVDPNKGKKVNSPSSADSSKSSVGRAKRRRIRKRRSPEVVGKEYVTQGHRRSNKDSIDLNNHPKVHSNSCSYQYNDEASSSLGHDSLSNEIRATHDVGREIGFQIGEDEPILNQIMGVGDVTRVAQ
ncbi:hypothetical protein L2E82_37544 [Cichorium intybus]|uniref:Uncharacterized protein n=1 Tax=Cichorium intybus TaxID=13427 RepID=A0ACB9AF59_CICIN|nr:hypothetical protein L2E82_37544 [Cichorium intybus]